MFFFFQAEDGIRDVAVTGVQTCALPIYPTEMEAAIVEPPPIKGSRTIPTPSGKEARTICRMNDCGFKDGCEQIDLSSGRVGAEAMTSQKGISAEVRRRPPVFHFRRLS